MTTTHTAAPTLLEPYLAQVDMLFAHELQTDLEPVQKLVRHVAKFRGKMLRPMLVLLAGMAAKANFTPRQEHVVMATVVEMAHIATLVHDDVLDGAEIRRKGATINHLQGNEAAVLLGDFLISHAYHLCSSLNSQQASRMISRATNVVCEGELTQNANRGNLELTEAVYFDIIYRKTAALTEVCCQLGALFATDDSEVYAALGHYGRQCGIAFQIVDDILDIVGKQRTVGKSLGTDIEKAKMTLPMIHFLRDAAPEHRALLRGLLESRDSDRVERVRQLLAPSTSITYARTTAQRYVDEAVAALQVLPPSPARDLLQQMAVFITRREH